MLLIALFLIDSWFSLLQETLGLGSLWSISFAGVIAKWLRCDPVKKGGWLGAEVLFRTTLFLCALMNAL